MSANLRAILAVLAGGLVSAGLVISVETQSLWRLLLLGLSPLPLFVSGLSAGPLTCLAAGLTGTVAVTLKMGSGAGPYYLAIGAVPVAILVWRALRIVRRQGQAFRENGGNLLLWLTGLGIIGVIGLVLYFALFEQGLVSAIRERFDMAPQAAAMLARIAPGLVAAIWMAVIAADGAIAEWLLARRGLALRPPIDIKRLMLPLWVGPVLMVAGLAGAILRQGTVGIVCLNCAIVLVVPFAFLGLATIHTVARRLRGGIILIGAAYTLLLGSPALMGWPALLVFALGLAGLGSVDQVLDLRDLRGLRSGMKVKRK
ncbi:MAG TPA: hypothetical protein VKZ79_10865 [Alphaproteobacteria bacterium]|nr:hypothetical protein [Alphaproteobacteria bacterium]